jgi:hypothetical protein
LPKHWGNFLAGGGTDLRALHPEVETPHSQPPRRRLPGSRHPDHNRTIHAGIVANSTSETACAG